MDEHFEMAETVKTVENAETVEIGSGFAPRLDPSFSPSQDFSPPTYSLTNTHPVILAYCTYFYW